MTSRSERTPSGGATACRRSRTLPSRFVTVPVSSAHCVTGNTTSANAAVSDSTTSHTARKSSARNRDVTKSASGADTTGFDPATSRARISDTARCQQLHRRTPRARQRVGG